MSDERNQPGVFHSFSGHVVHLYLPRYRVGRKPRSTYDQGLCGAHAWDCQDAPVQWYDEARPVLSPPYRWCAKCLGLALANAGLTPTAVRMVAPYFRPEEAS